MQSNQRLVIVRWKDQILSALFSERELLELHCDKIEEESILGNIYIGKVQNIVKNINAAFVEISDKKVCYLPLTEDLNLLRREKNTNHKLLQGEELLVQISKEDVKTKAPVATTKLSSPGKYLVLVYGKPISCVSSKIEDPKRRQELKNSIEPYVTEAYGFIVRTNAKNAEENYLIQEAKVLVNRYLQLKKDGKYQNRFSKIFQMLPAYLCTIRDRDTESLSEIITDDPILYQQIKEYLTCYQPEDLQKLRMPEDSSISLDRVYRISLQLNEALQKRVWLKSGGYLVIEPTEALTVIDVNTGKAVTKKKNVQETFFQINVEAAKEIAKQIRLRNISGIIIIDFINMQEEKAREDLLYTLKEFVKQDPVKTTVIDMTALSLVELTRKKERRPLYEQVERTTVNSIKKD